MPSILGLNYGELEHLLASWQERIFHARQIFSWIYKKGITDFSLMSDIASTLRSKLKKEFSILELRLIKVSESRDKTKKFLFTLRDGEPIEAVIIPAENRITACISSQVGCKYGCSFCASGVSGFKRNLDTAEIMQEVLFLNNYLRPKKLTHIVFMGTGEPLDNYDSVLKAIRIINSPQGLNIGARRITISTSGIIPGIERLSREGLQIELSVSLHSAVEKVRSRMMPVNRIFPLPELLDACLEYIQRTNRQITFEYVLIKNLNAHPDAAEALVKLLKPLKLAKVNLIPANQVKELGIEPPNKLETLHFKGYLVKHGLHSTLRKSRGDDIDAACGQLRLNYVRQ
jgi:23S rRNA (adenine2503-C2)-methyltransferase